MNELIGINWLFYLLVVVIPLGIMGIAIWALWDKFDDELMSGDGK